MTQLDQAVRHDLADAPEPPPVQRLRRRARRRQRQRATQVIVVVGAFTLGAATVVHYSTQPTAHVNVSPITGQRSLMELVKPILPAGATLHSAPNGSEPASAYVIYDLQNGQKLAFARERVTESSDWPGQINPELETLIRLPTGSRLLQYAHGYLDVEVSLLRPNGTMIDAHLYTLGPTPELPRSEAEQKRLTRTRLDWLTALVERHLDTPSSDIK
jgi:hypothetical protein